MITENLPGTKSVKKIPGIGGLIGQVCSVTKFLFVYNDKPVPTNQATYCLWYVAVERIKKINITLKWEIVKPKLEICSI